MAAVSTGNLDLVRELWADEPVIKVHTALMRASRHGHLDIVKYLLDDPRVNPSEYCGGTFHNAASYGRYDIVKYLLTNPHVDQYVINHPYIINHTAIDSVNYGHLNILELLLGDPRIDPACSNNLLIQTAVWNGNFKIVKRLMEDPRVNPAEAIVAAVTISNTDILEYMLTDHRVLATYTGPASVKKACKAMSRTQVFKQELLERVWSGVKN